ncbi:MAG: adenylate/guanylate cyclase domain-containing protein [Gemmatimonadota bacterium]|nr:adenylate/guanylate cyclase domain-containing protein [Gemmatimonadota bacterium]MDQ8147464.1 adenylate/guanylate cyclase domain-containing protein [Gemmatimonadota bacterium]MDQ8148755.1 adenylate/guanylate cyclase domain-containing protein [Gemmatimonadota bacterium]MDQ8156734.1 adenylate/guanylate cyclase domain-containing protein [Gemmatimonadota bacterium]MDQ8176504.1 adenylate/guanylate cyclase domain-containing protein [Gemmatimonadota bacterium]
MSYRLVGISTAQHGEFADRDVVIVGRAVTSDLAVVDATVSRQHAELRARPEGIEVRDLGSSNGTFVNGTAIETAVAQVGDEVMFGKVAFRVEAVAITPAATPAATPAKPLVAPVRPLHPPRAAEPAGRAMADAPVGGTIVRQIPRAGTAVLGAAPAEADGDRRGSDRRRLDILLEVSKGLGKSVDIDALLEKIVEYAFQVLETDRCAILLTDAAGQLTPKLSRDRRGSDAPGAVPQSIAQTAVEQQVAILSDDAAEDQRFTGQSIVMQKVRSAMCVPLVSGEMRVLGILYVDNFSIRKFVESDLDFLIAFAGLASVALENGQLADRIRREALARSNFERFFTPALAARIASSPEAVKLGGDKRRVAVLFSDIRGFTALSETMNPDAMARLLTEYFTEMVECVFRHGGTLDKFIGDAVMAQWGAPIGALDDCDRAMQAALDMMTGLDALNARWRAEQRPTLEIGIGLNVGDVFAGNIGSDRRLEYTVIGDSVNVSSRLCGAAGPGEILISSPFRDALASPPPLDALPPMELKGKSQPLPVFRVQR